jgi:hypothetical protein
VESGNGIAKVEGGTAIIGGGSQPPEAEPNLSEALASSEQAAKEAKTAADNLEVWDKGGHLGVICSKCSTTSQKRKRRLIAPRPSQRHIQAILSFKGTRQTPRRRMTELRQLQLGDRSCSTPSSECESKVSEMQ